jgi:CMP-N,N'-diacetyllegionaminic acid synthase
MRDSDRTVVFILARAGSKRLPGKNIKLLKNKPLIEYVIEVAKSSNKVDDILISTDSDQIVDLVESLGGCKTLLRPIELATDDASSVDALMHAFDWYEESFMKVNKVILMQVTSPFTEVKTLNKCIDLLDRFDSIMTVSESSKKIQWFGTKNKDGHFTYILDDYDIQVKEKQYTPSGNIYGVRGEYFKDNKKLYSKDNNFALSVGSIEAIDIDYMEDLKFAEFVLIER